MIAHGKPYSFYGAEAMIEPAMVELLDSHGGLLSWILLVSTHLGLETFKF